MKFSTGLALALAPLVLARNVRNSYPVQAAARRSADAEHELDSREIAIIKGMKGAGLTANAKTEIIIIWANPGNGAATTTINEKVTVTQTVTAGAQATEVTNGGATTTLQPGETATVPGTAGASHTVTVGGPAGLIFTPDQLPNIPVGDFVVFEFLSKNHTVTQSTFKEPCVAMAGGMDSGFMANPDNTVQPPPQVAMQVMTTDPLWFYCKQSGHCGKGMTFSINPTSEKSQALFQQAAIAQNGTGTATPITGGTGGGNAAAPAAPAASSAAGTQATTASAPAATGGSGATPGTGTIGADGSCQCVVACSAGGFPAANAQGLGGVGGISGSLPMAMAMMR